jgi:hypothetical protein
MKATNFFPLLFLLVLMACNEEPKEADNFDKYVLKDTIPTEHKDVMDKFKFPDSVKKELIIATFYETDAVANSVIFYTDKDAKLAELIRYFPNGSSLWEHLKQTKEKEFSSLTNPNGTFVLTDSTVNYSKEDHGMGYSYQHRRTDFK